MHQLPSCTRSFGVFEFFMYLAINLLSKEQLAKIFFQCGGSSIELFYVICLSAPFLCERVSLVPVQFQSSPFHQSLYCQLQQFWGNVLLACSPVFMCWDKGKPLQVYMVECMNSCLSPAPVPSLSECKTFHIAECALQLCVPCLRNARITGTIPGLCVPVPQAQSFTRAGPALRCPLCPILSLGIPAMLQVMLSANECVDSSS